VRPRTNGRRNWDRPRGRRPDETSFPRAQASIRAVLCDSKVGFGICETQLRYHAINRALAATNRRSPRDHLGATIHDVLGHVAADIEPAFECVLSSKKPVLKEISGRIPTREDVVHWIANYFPVKDSSGKVRGLGAIVVEVTEHKALQVSLQLLGQELLRSKEKNTLEE
jgi:two-component system, sensor histidine kinase and response regulator